MPSISETSQISQIVASTVRSQLAAMAQHHSGSITHTEFFNSCPPHPLRSDMFWMKGRLSPARALKMSPCPDFDPLRSEPELQALLDEQMTKVKTIGGEPVTCKYYNTTSNPFLNGRKPDGTFVVPGWRASAAAIVMVAEVKVSKQFTRCTSTVAIVRRLRLMCAHISFNQFLAFVFIYQLPIYFQTADQGQLMTFLARVLDAQPDRAFIFGFLTNMTDIMFMRAVRVQGRDSFEVFGEIEQNSALSKQCLGALSAQCCMT
jgi:hypothetical protein